MSGGVRGPAAPRQDDEEDHQLYKQVSGLDSCHVTTWTSCYRWTRSACSPARSSPWPPPASAYHREHEGAVEPGATYGPSPFVQRAIHQALFTGSLLTALRGELKRGVRP